MLSPHGLLLVLWKLREEDKAQLASHSGCQGNGVVVLLHGFYGDSCNYSNGDKSEENIVI